MDLIKERRMSRVSTAYQGQIPGVVKKFSRNHLLFSRSPILDKTRSNGLKKGYVIIEYDDKTFIVFDYYKRYLTETQFGINVQGFYSPDKSKLLEYSRSFPLLKGTLNQ